MNSANKQLNVIDSRYVLKEILAYGRSGTIYKARDLAQDQYVAIKIVDFKALPESTRKGLAALTHYEVSNLTAIEHPNIIKIFNHGTVNNIPYVVMELIIGKTLLHYTQPDCLLPIPQVLDIAATIALALDFAHKRDVIHLDIKPSNIMMSEYTNKIKLMDFVTATIANRCLEITRKVLGSPSYMSPEQASGKSTDHTSDLFSLGISIYQLLTSKLPFDGSDSTQLGASIIHKPHKPVHEVEPAVPKPISLLVDHALKKSPKERFQSGEEMAQAFLDAKNDIVKSTVSWT